MYNERMQNKNNMWYLNNNANNHLYKDKDKFTKLDKSIRDNVAFENHSKIAIKNKHGVKRYSEK